MSLLKRGFKTWCENAAGGYRRDLGIHRHGPLDPRLLTAQLGIEIWKPTDIPGLEPSVVNHLLNVDPESWSALTLTVKDMTVIIVNSSHSRQRENSNLAHEMSHIILKHEPSKVFVTADGQMVMNHYNELHEEEAGCLSAALLVPRDALLALMAAGYSQNELLEHFDVSPQMLSMRINLTGVTRQLSRRVATV